MLELRRRVRSDPSSIAFAQLAEECRRSGANAEAVGICRAGLAHHPGYLSARVTLGRALIELGQLDEAQAELDIVVGGAPANLAAIRGLAEICQRRGQMAEALEYYKRALELARHDPDLEDTVERISQAVTPAPVPQPRSLAKVEQLFDFDTLITQLGADLTAPTAPEVFAAQQPPAPTALDAVELKADDTDQLATVERDLRDLEARRATDDQLARTRLADRRRETVLTELDTWLAAIASDQARPPS